MKIKWTVAPAPTGRYRSFEKRSWPSADYADGSYAGSIVCTGEGYGSEYNPRRVKTGDHPPLKLRFAHYGLGEPHSWKAVFSKGTYATLPEAKAAFARILKQFPDMMPREKAE